MSVTNCNLLMKKVLEISQVMMFGISDYSSYTVYKNKCKCIHQNEATDRNGLKEQVCISVGFLPGIQVSLIVVIYCLSKVSLALSAFQHIMV